MKRILIIKLRAIGDVVMATPALENLRLACPDAHIAFLTEEASGDILKHSPWLDELIVLPRRAWRFMPFPARLRAQIRFYRALRRRRFDTVIDLFGNPRSAILTLLSGAKRRVGYAFRIRRLCYNLVVRPRGGEVHEVEFNLDALRALGVPVRITQPGIAVPESYRTEARVWLEQRMPGERSFLIGMNPGGGWAIKRWPPERFAKLADTLIREHGVRILLIWGPGERALVDGVVSKMAASPLTLPETTLLEMAGFLTCCDLLISNDSGPMHMAAALGVPTIGIFGPTNPFLQGPYGTVNRFVRQESVPCLGCNRLRCPTRNECMTHLNPDTVLKTVIPFLRPLTDAMDTR